MVSKYSMPKELNEASQDNEVHGRHLAGLELRNRLQDGQTRHQKVLAIPLALECSSLEVNL